MDSIQFFHPHSVLRATSSKSTSLLQIKSQQRAAKATTRRVDRETALTRIQIASNGVVGKEHTCSSYISDTDDDNEFPSVEELLQQPSHIKNSLKERANHHFTPQRTSQPFHQIDDCSSNARPPSLASGMGNSKETPLVIDDDESEDEDEDDDDNIANDKDYSIADGHNHNMANDEDGNTANDDSNIADDDNIDDDDDAATTNGSENATSEQHPHPDGKQIDKPEQSSDGNDDQDDNGQDNDTQSHKNEESQPAKRRRLDPALDCNYKRRIQPTRECRLKDVLWPEGAYTLLDNSQHKRPSSVRSSNHRYSKRSAICSSLIRKEPTSNIGAEYYEWPMHGYLKRIVIGNEIRYGMEFSLELSQEQQEEVGALVCLTHASSSITDRNLSSGHTHSCRGQTQPKKTTNKMQQNRPRGRPKGII